MMQSQFLEQNDTDFVNFDNQIKKNDSFKDQYLQSNIKFQLKEIGQKLNEVNFDLITDDVDQMRQAILNLNRASYS